MEIKQEKKQEKSPGQEQKDSQLQSSNFAAGAERSGAQMSDNSKGRDSQINLSNERFSGAASRELPAQKSGDQGGKDSLVDLSTKSMPEIAARSDLYNEARELRKAMESKATNVPEIANKQKLKEQ